MVCLCVRCVSEVSPWPGMEWLCREMDRLFGPDPDGGRVPVRSGQDPDGCVRSGNDPGDCVRSGHGGCVASGRLAAACADGSDSSAPPGVPFTGYGPARTRTGTRPTPVPLIGVRRRRLTCGDDGSPPETTPEDTDSPSAGHQRPGTGTDISCATVVCPIQ